jgi:hypothetical protein
MDGHYLEILLALAAIVLPLALAAVLVEWRARPKMPPRTPKRRGKGST